MRKNFGAKPLSYPQPVFIVAAYGEDDVPCAMNVAWGGMSDYTEMLLCIAKDHQTTINLRKRGAFTISMATVDYLDACDYVGIVTGKKVPDKFEKAGFHATKSQFVDAPLIDELPLALECKLISYDEESEIARSEIVNVGADERILNEQGKIDPQLLKPIIFDPFNNDYLVVGEKVGNAFKDGLKLR